MNKRVIKIAVINIIITLAVYVLCIIYDIKGGCCTPDIIVDILKFGAIVKIGYNMLLIMIEKIKE